MTGNPIQTDSYRRGLFGVCGQEAYRGNRGPTSAFLTWLPVQLLIPLALAWLLPLVAPGSVPEGSSLEGRLSQNFSLAERTQVTYPLGSQSSELEGFSGLLSRGQQPHSGHVALELGRGGPPKELRVLLPKEGRRGAGHLGLSMWQLAENWQNN